MQFKDRIKSGLNGDYVGLNNGFNRINDYVYGVQRSCYTLIGGQSGAAKSTLADFILLNALQDAKSKNITVNVFYYSYEIDEVSKKANWLSVLIYNKYQTVIPPQRIKGLGKERLSPEEQEMVFDTLPELEDLFSRIMWRWEATNPTGIYTDIWDFMKSRGTFEKESYIKEDKSLGERIVKFNFNDPNEYNLIFLDHLALLKLERGFTLKQNIDKLSEYMIFCRNLFKLSVFLIQQFNQALSSIERLKFKGADISPQQSDFKDTTNPYSDSDVALGIMNSYKNDLDTHLGYYINLEGYKYNLKSKFRLLKVVKNRLGPDNIAIGLYFKPEAGYFEELPKVSEMTDEKYQLYLNK